MQRRAFLEKSLYAAAFSCFSSWSCLTAEAQPPKPKNILVLGGTFYLGPAVVEAALAAGHSVTIIQSWHYQPGPFPKCRKAKGSAEPESCSGRSIIIAK